MSALGRRRHPESRKPPPKGTECSLSANSDRASSHCRSLTGLDSSQFARAAMSFVKRDVLGNAQEHSFAKKALSPEKQIDRRFRSRETEQMLITENVASERSEKCRSLFACDRGHGRSPPGWCQQSLSHSVRNRAHPWSERSLVLAATCKASRSKSCSERPVGE